METQSISNTRMLDEIRTALISDRPSIPSKYFYDKRGSELFEKIMRMPEYYLTDTETEILNNAHQKITRFFLESDRRINLVELGAGDGIKTRILIESLMDGGANLTYVPIDISKGALDNLTQRFTATYPQLKISPRHKDYESGLQSLKQEKDAINVVLFLGSTLGNFQWEDGNAFIKMISDNLNEQDILFIGLDLVKDPDVILEAYNDKAGITAEFNYNLLRRLNRDLDANFDLSKWRHHPVYDLEKKAALSYLLATEEQQIRFDKDDDTIIFRKWDFICTEISQKYDIRMMKQLAKNNGFKVVTSFFDTKKYFVNAIWQKRTTPWNGNQ